jgi:hypothetical protein
MLIIWGVDAPHGVDHLQGDDGSKVLPWAASSRPSGTRPGKAGVTIAI